MKKAISIVVSVVITAVLALSVTACTGKGKSSTLGEPVAMTYPSSEELKADGFSELSNSAKTFSFTLSENALSSYNKSDNFVLSPINVFAALALAAECADGKTREQILSAMGTDYDTLLNNYGTLIRTLNRTFITGELNVYNSIWLDDKVPFKQNAIDSLSQKYYCYSYSADFKGDNKNANKAVRYFVKEQTHGLIDRDFELSTETAFALISSLYLKDNWLSDSDLKYTTEKYVFKGTEKNTETEFLTGRYIGGRAYDGEGYKMFYTSTCTGFKLKFIVPDDGIDVRDIFNAKTMSEANSIYDFNAIDNKTDTHYYTRCIFPEFDASYTNDLKPFLKSMGITDLFEFSSCDLSNLIPESYPYNVACGKVAHSATLAVDKKGIEGAAVTVIDGNVESALPPKHEVYEDFVVDKSFGFILTNASGIPLFTGIVNGI